MTEPPRSLSESAYESLTRLIVQCKLPPGEWVSEKQLTELTGLGLGPVRTAMARLRHDGLLIAVPRVGYRVSPITIDDVTDLFDTWAIVGPAIVDLAFKRATDQQIDEFEAKSSELAARVHDGQEWEHGLLDLGFGLLVGMTGSRRLADIYERLRTDVARCFYVAALQGAKLTAVTGAREEIVALMRRRDHDEAVSRARDLVESTRELVLGVLHTSPGIADAELRVPSQPV
ncbi:GntR family transcriptional regulator [Streptomyces griseorubiginosus]|uniref:GntR family transcriptional regulator n=1 Tax=Streptomyces griseorubiginosus TaxID=67304 RepID=UPI001AD76361|nr:GntR family transcriptional regulator [Streptomyces griseorubiginosus]MBO4252316.1 FCD domain-containing protein [Streptomyces griseorubiginosus]